MKIIVVDDNVDAVTTLTQYLQLRGHAVTLATSGPAAMAKMMETEYDAIVTDLSMPVMSGQEMIRTALELKRLPPHVIVLTGLDPWFGTKEPGVQKVLRKPVNPADVAAALEERGGDSGG